MGRKDGNELLVTKKSHLWLVPPPQKRKKERGKLVWLDLCYRGAPVLFHIIRMPQLSVAIRPPFFMQICLTAQQSALRHVRVPALAFATTAHICIIYHIWNERGASVRRGVG